MKNRFRESFHLGVTVIAIIVIIYGGTILLSNTQGTSKPMMVVISQSMVPNIGVGDFILLEAIEDFDEITVGEAPIGDILVFLHPGTYDEYIVHRAIERYESNDGWVFQTMGDNNPFPDSFQVSEKLVIGKVKSRIPVVGYFSLFMRTTKGFTLIAGLIVVSFFYDTILPRREYKNAKGKFNYLALTPFLVSPAIIMSIWFYPSNHKTLELTAIATWYIGCLFLPLTTDDEDTCLIFWLYHFILLIIPIACDLSWWTLGITPNNWWPIQGSTIPISWLLFKETSLFQESFNTILVWLGPGIVMFFGLLYIKRNNVLQIRKYSDRLRGI